jgi:Icc-related predicted phosphoesterase
MKILVIGDLHGRKPKIHFKDFDCIIQTGDVCDDSKIGLLYKKYFEIIKENPDFGLGPDEFFIKEVGKKRMKTYERESLEKGHKILKYLDSFEKPIFMVAGNWDQSYGNTKIKDMNKSDYNYMKAFYDWYLGDKINSKLIKGLKNIHNCMFKNYVFSKINFVGYGLSSGGEKLNRNGNHRKLKLSDKEYNILKSSIDNIFNKLYSAYKKRNKEFPTLFISHNIPYDTKLDIGKNKKSYAYGKHLGSYVARKFCEKYSPLVCVGGHVHEGRGKDKIGRTLVINPGFGKDAQVLVDIDGSKDKIRNVKFYGKK